MKEEALVGRIIMLSANPNLEIQREALFVLCNAASCGGQETLEYLLSFDNHSLIDTLNEGLKQRDQVILKEVLSTIYRIVDSELVTRGEQDVDFDPSVIFKIKECDLIDKLYDLAEVPIFEDISSQILHKFSFFNDIEKDQYTETQEKNFNEGCYLDEMDQQMFNI